MGTTFVGRKTQAIPAAGFAAARTDNMGHYPMRSWREGKGVSGRGAVAGVSGLAAAADPTPRLAPVLTRSGSLPPSPPPSRLSSPLPTPRHECQARQCAGRGEGTRQREGELAALQQRVTMRGRGGGQDGQQSKEEKKINNTHPHVTPADGRGHAPGRRRARRGASSQWWRTDLVGGGPEQSVACADGPLSRARVVAVTLVRGRLCKQNAPLPLGRPTAVLVLAGGAT